MATIKEIAREAGVSIGTVDRVLHDRGMVNEQTKQRVLAVMKELNYQPNHVAQGLAVRKKKLKLHFLCPDTGKHPFFLAVLNAAQKKAEELKQYGVEVTFSEVKLDSLLTPEKESGLWKEIEEVDGLAMIGMDLPETTAFLNEVEKRGLPVVFYNADIPSRRRLAYVGCDYIKSGRLAAGLCALAGGEDARVCIYSEGGVQGRDDEGQDEQWKEMRSRYAKGGTGIASHDERLKGFCQEMQERYPEMKVLDIRSISDNQIDNYLSAQEMLQKYPDVNIVYVMNPADYGICEAVSRADGKHQVRIITNDLAEEQMKMIRKGIISATVCQEPEKQGRQPLDILFRYLAFGELPEEKMQYTNLSIHIVQNI